MLCFPRGAEDAVTGEQGISYALDRYFRSEGEVLPHCIINLMPYAWASLSAVVRFILSQKMPLQVSSVSWRFPSCRLMQRTIVQRSTIVV